MLFTLFHSNLEYLFYADYCYRNSIIFDALSPPLLSSCFHRHSSYFASSIAGIPCHSLFFLFYRRYPLTSPLLPLLPLLPPTSPNIPSSPSSLSSTADIPCHPLFFLPYRRYSQSFSASDLLLSDPSRSILRYHIFNSLLFPSFYSTRYYASRFSRRF